MRFLSLSVIALGLARYASAFTNGTLIPSYMCNNVDGYPKSAGTIIPFLKLGTALDMYNAFPPGNGTAITIAINADAAATNAVAPTARQIIGAFHNGGAEMNSTAGNPLVLQAVTPVVYEKALTNAVWMAPMGASDVTGLGDYTIKLGAVNSFIIASHCPAPDPRGFNNVGVAVDGFLAYAIDNATGKRIGSWINVGPTMSAFYGCNNDGTNYPAVGIVHNQLVSGNSNVANLTWMAPANVQGTITFKGVGVSDCGFGPFSITYNTTANTGAPSATAQGLNPNQQGMASAAAVAPFVLKAAAPDLVGAAAAMTNLATTSTAATTMYSAGTVAGIAVAGAVGGALVIGGVLFFIQRRNSGSY